MKKLLILLLSLAGPVLAQDVKVYPSGTVPAGGGAWDSGTNGIVVRTAPSTAAAREITTTSLVVQNGDGVAANPSIDLDTATTPQFTSGTGAVSATGAVGTFYFKTDTGMYYYKDTDTPVAVASSIAVVVPNTGTASTTALQSGDIFTNTGDADGSELDLLNDPTVGVNYSVVVTAAQTITVAPAAGETLYLNAASCANVTSATVGAALSVVAVVGGSGGIWVASGAGWTCN